MILAGIDPGSEKSAYLIYDSDYTRINKIVTFEIIENEYLIKMITANAFAVMPKGSINIIALEHVQSFGMAVGKDVFETCYFIGRITQACITANITCHRIYRKDVKMYLCNNTHAKDSNIRQSLIDIFGPGKDKAIGKKATPGPLFGIKEDIWSALAIVMTYIGKSQNTPVPF